MEIHTGKPHNNTVIIIPARYASVRLPGKMLREIAGKPLILHTLGQAQQVRNISRVIVATDDDRIFRAVVDGGGEAVMTSPVHQSGSDRLAEVAETLPAYSIIVNVQGDEPTISPKTIEAAINALQADPEADISTTAEQFTSLVELIDANVVKVVTGADGYALYFSRSPMPFPREHSQRFGGDLGAAVREMPELLALFRKHTGLYAYRREYLLKFTKMPQSRLEKIEMLEQLRALEYGAKIRVVDVDEPSVGVDTADDLERVRRIIEQKG